MVYYRLRNFGEAVCCFDQAGDILSDRNRNHADLFAARAFCRLYTNQSQLAKDDVQTAVRLSGKGLLPCLAMSEYLRIEGYFLSSLKWLERGIKANEEASARMLVNRGNIYLKCLEYEDAMADFEKAHSLDPSNINASNGLAMPLMSSWYTVVPFFVIEFSQAVSPDKSTYWRAAQRTMPQPSVSTFGVGCPE